MMNFIIYLKKKKKGLELGPSSISASKMWAKRLEMGKILRLLQKGSQIARPWATQLMCFTTRENKKLKEMS